jgi:hypothetical protein
MSNLFENNPVSNNSIIIFSLGSYPSLGIEEEFPNYIYNKYSGKYKFVLHCVDPFYEKINYNNYKNQFYNKYKNNIEIKEINDNYTKWSCPNLNITIFHITKKLENYDISDKWLSILKKQYNVDSCLLTTSNLKVSGYYLDDKNKLKTLEKLDSFWNQLEEYFLKNILLNNKIFINNRAITNSKYPGIIPRITLIGNNLKIKYQNIFYSNNLYLEKQPELCQILYKLHSNINFRRNLFYSYNNFKDSKISLTNYI